MYEKLSSKHNVCSVEKRFCLGLVPKRNERFIKLPKRNSRAVECLWSKFPKASIMHVNTSHSLRLSVVRFR